MGRFEKRQARLEAQMLAVSTDLKDVRKHVTILWRKLESEWHDGWLDRYAALRADRAPIPTHHQDPDGAVLSILNAVGVEHRTFLDIGCGRTGGQSRVLHDLFGWKGTFVDASEATIAELTYARLNAAQLIVTPENVNSLGTDVDLLSIDIDSYDYWVWKAVTGNPRMVIVEYNSHFGHEPVTVPYNAITDETPKGYYGASLAAMYELGVSKGYSLLGCDRQGVNAYFARSDLIDPSLAQTAEEAWRPNLNRTAISDIPRNPGKVMHLITETGLPLERVERSHASRA